MFWNGGAPGQGPAQPKERIVMRCRVIVAGLVVFIAAGFAFAAPPPSFTSCPKQADGHTSDQPPDPVVICQQLFPTAPFVRLPPDQRLSADHATLYGVVELDINNNGHIQNARFYD